MTQTVQHSTYQKSAARLFRSLHRPGDAMRAERRAAAKRWLPIQTLCFALLVSLTFWWLIFAALKRVI
jgi:cell division septal protein FtsQ